MMERIEIDPKKMGGKPVIKGTRIPVYFILELLANGWSFEEILENYPQLTKEDILAAIRYASIILKEEQYVEVSG
ncbi:antitoxin [Thermococcus profundus]|uniref:Antitoxin n=2 Tax=Thermococcus profundus TaxID=49899 RepID=A0A2Z2MP98_THEPR|nr:antitoxin [Thermococcus profundus]